MICSPYLPPPAKWLRRLAAGRADFIDAIIDHLPPKGKQTVRYYGLYSNKTRGQQSLIPDRIIRPPESSPNLKSPISNVQSAVLLIPAPPKQSARSMPPLWRDLILKVWGADHLSNALKRQKTQAWHAPEIHLDDGRILVLEFT